MRAIYSFCTFLCIEFIFSSCSNEVEDTIEGWWTINDIFYKNESLLTSLSGNSITFEDEECQFPSFSNNTFNRYNKGVWELVNSEDTYLLKVTTQDKIFTGTYKVTFEEDLKNKLLKMNLVSDSLDIKCRKGLFNFDKNRGLIRRLIKN